MSSLRIISTRVMAWVDVRLFALGSYSCDREFAKLCKENLSNFVCTVAVDLGTSIGIQNVN